MKFEEPNTALERLETQHNAEERVGLPPEQHVEDFLEPLTFAWDEEGEIVARAIQRYVAQFDANH